MLLILGIFLLSFVSASIDYIEENETYVVNSVWPTWLGGNGESIVKLIDNTDYCLIDCEATLEFNNEEPISLLEGIGFVDRLGNDVSKDIKKLDFIIGRYEDVEYKNKTYETICEDILTNSTNETICKEVESGEVSYFVNELVWRKYSGTEENGLSYLKIKAKKDLRKDIDWIITFRGKELSEWAWWDSNWQYKKEISELNGTISSLYNVTYEANMRTDFGDLRFLDNATESIELNYTIISKVDGVSARVRVDNLNISAIKMYYGNSGVSTSGDFDNLYFSSVSSYIFDNSNAKDETSGTNDGTIIGASFISNGTIGGAYNFSGSDYISYSSSWLNHADPISISMWIKQDSLGTHGLFSDISGGNGIGFYEAGGFIQVRLLNSGTSTRYQTSSVVIGTNEWTHLVITKSSGTTTQPKIYVNGTSVAVSSISNSNGADDIVIGRIFGGFSQDGGIDEVYIYNKELSQTEITYINEQTQPNFTEGAEEQNQGVSTVLINPSSLSNFTNPFINFTFSSIPNQVNLTNATLYLWNNSDGSLILTNFTALSGNLSVNTTLSNNLSQGNYKWNAETCSDNIGCSFASSNFSFVVHTGTPEILIFNPVETLDYILNGENETLNYSIAESGVNLSTHLVDCWYEYSGNTTNLTNSTWSGAFLDQLSFLTNFTIVEEINISMNDGGSISFSTIDEACFNRERFTIKQSPFFEIDGAGGNTFTCLDIDNQEYGLGTYTPRATANQTNITHQVKQPLNCSDNIENFAYIFDKNELCVHAVDEFGLKTLNTTIWDYRVIELSQTYNNQTTEGTFEDFSANISLQSGLSIVGAAVIYNGTTSVGSSSTSGGITTLTASNVLIPAVSTDANLSFYWTLVLSDTSVINLSTQNQTVFNLALDNCSTFTNRLFNFTARDEEMQNVLSGDTTKEIAINIFDQTRTVTAVNLSAEYDNNPTLICLNRNLTEGSNYSLDTIIRYEADGYANEYYNIVDLELTKDTEEQKIQLYNINLNDSTDFQLTFTGEDFLPVEDALVFVERQYIAENTFKTVELPKTDSNGQTVLHLVRNDIIYNIIVMKDKQILGSFDNLIAFCDDFSIGDCKISLNAIGTDSGVPNYDEEIGILFDSAPEYNETTKVVSFSFTSVDGTSKTVLMDVERRDVFGNTSVCSNVLVSTSGTVSCNVGNISETSLITTISVDGEDKLNSKVAIDTEAYGPIGYAMAFILTFALILLFGDTKNGTIIALFIGYVVAIAAGWMIGGVIGAGSAGIWIAALTFTGLWLINKNKQS